MYIVSGRRQKKLERVRMSIRNSTDVYGDNQNTLEFTTMIPIEPVKCPSVQIEASCHRACPSAASTSPCARNSSDSTGIHARSSCVGFHSDACGYLSV